MPIPPDATYGYSRAQLRVIAAPPPPAGFADFWRATHAEAEATPLALERLPARELEGQQVYEVRFNGWRGGRLGAWVIEPPQVDWQLGLVEGHGYGGREAPAPTHGVAPRAVRLEVLAPGFHLSAAPDLPRNNSALHVVHGLTDRDAYLIRACVVALWAAARALRELYPRLERIAYWGGSFGGGLGALALPWEPRFERGILEVPTFGHHPLRLQCPCCGSGEAVRELVRQQPAAASAVLPWYDAATAATFITQPVLTAPATSDPAVPPPGQFAVANAIRSPGSRVFEYTVGHTADHPSSAPEAAAFAQLAREFLYPAGAPS
jgi:cephalosporin-C deacetylase